MIVFISVSDWFRLREYIVYFINRKEREDVLYKTKKIKAKTKSKIFWSSHIGLFTTCSLVVIGLIWTLPNIATNGIEFNMGLSTFMIYMLLFKNIRESTQTVRGRTICKIGISFGTIFTNWHGIKK